MDDGKVKFRINSLAAGSVESIDLFAITRCSDNGQSTLHTVDLLTASINPAHRRSVSGPKQYTNQQMVMFTCLSRAFIEFPCVSDETYAESVCCIGCRIVFFDSLFTRRMRDSRHAKSCPTNWSRGSAEPREFTRVIRQR